MPVSRVSVSFSYKQIYLAGNAFAADLGSMER